MEPTEEQIKKFWERWGFTFNGTYWRHPKGYYFDSVDGAGFAGGEDISWYSRRPPHLDLSNLFEYAVPKLGKTLIGIDFIPPYRKQKEWLCNVELDKKPLKSYRAIGDTPALALFWAIYKVMEAK